MLFVLLESRAQNLPLIVELLAELVIEGEIIKPPKADHGISAHFCRDSFVESFFPDHLLGPIESKEQKLWAMSRNLINNIEGFLVKLGHARQSVLVNYILKGRLAVVVLDFLEGLANDMFRIYSLLLNLICVVISYNMFF